MKRDLFRDVLNEGIAPDFEEAVFRKTVARAKRTHRTRIAVRSGLLALAVAAIALFSWPRRDVVIVRHPPKTPAVVVVSHKTIQTEPFQNVLRTGAANSQRSIATSVSSVSIVTTADSGPGVLRVINDDELLRLLEGKAVALVNRGRDNAELIFLDESGPK